MAAIRETLIAVKKSIDDIGVSSIDCDPTILMSSLTLICARLSTKIERALAAPPRNCDTPYNDRVEMYGAFKDWCNARGHTMNPKLACDAFDWLLAPATEQKGETNEK